MDGSHRIAMTDRAAILAEHYQKSFEITLDVWEKRNRTLVILLLVVGAATLLTLNVPQAQPLMVDLIAHLLTIEQTRQTELRTSFPYGLMQTILLMVVLYLTLVLYHQTTFILRSYKYLAALETDIRSELELADGATAFTREGPFYEKHRPLLSGAVAIAYTGLLGVLLVAFLGARIHADLSAQSLWVAALDVLLAVPTVLFYGAYVLEPHWNSRPSS
jgi:hypothetical protein